MPCKLDAVKSYTSGKKYKKLAADHAFNYDEYKEHLVPSYKKQTK